MILVTGGTGLVGSHLLLSLTKSGQRVRAIHRKRSSFREVEKIFQAGFSDPEQAKHHFAMVEWVEADALEVPSLVPAFEDIDRVYHCAALVSFSPADYRKLRKINIEGTANIVNLCIANRIRKLCFVSSIATLNLNIGQTEITEESHWNQELDHSMYAISKYGAEMEVWRASQEGVPVIIVQPGVIIGPGFWNSGSGEMFTKLERGLKYHFPKTTGFVGVKDVVDIMQLLMNSEVENEQFVLVAENLRFRKVLEMAAASINKPAPSRALKPWMVSLGWVGEKLFSPFTSKRRLTKDSITSLFSDSYYNSCKIKETLNYRFESMEKVINYTGEAFRKELGK